MLGVNVAWAEFQDPLDLPATQTSRAAMAPMNGIAVAGSRIVAVGRRGVIIVSDDNGKRWAQVASPVSVDLTAVYFPTAEQGWAVGHGGAVLHSRDGGLTWKKRLDGRQVASLVVEYYRHRAQSGDAAATSILPETTRFAEEGAIHPFLDVWFESEKVGYLIGAFNLILRTDDGGVNWKPWMERMDNPKGLHLYAVRGAQGRVFIVGEQGLLLRLDKAAQHFVSVETPYKGSYFGLAVRAENLVVVGLRGNAFHSQDQGKNWQQIKTKVQTAITAVILLEDDRAVLTAQGGEVLVVTNGEAAFSSPEGANQVPLAAVVAVGKDGLALAGLKGVSVMPLTANRSLK